MLKIKISPPLKKLIGGMLEKNYRFRIDDDSDLFDKWFNYIGPPIQRKKTLDDKIIKRKTENHFNYLTPTKSTALKRLPTHSYNNFYKIQNQQNLMTKFKESVINTNFKANIDGNISSQKFERKSLFLPLINTKNKNNISTINNGINGFRKPHKKCSEIKEPNVSAFQINKNDALNNNIIINDTTEEPIKEDIFENNDEEKNEFSNLYKTNLKSCKQVRLKKFI